jgi:hypothetical protein
MAVVMQLAQWVSLRHIELVANVCSLIIYVTELVEAKTSC